MATAREDYRGLHMRAWMKRLALHYERVKYLQPEDKLMILFDIDGTLGISNRSTTPIWMKAATD